MRSVPTPNFRWHSMNIRLLRSHLGLSQAAMAGEFGMRQQTISAWELGIYEPRGASVTILTLVALNSRFDFAGLV